MFGAADLGPGVVVGVDADGHVEREPVRQLVDRERGAPVVRAVVALVVEPGGTDDVDPRPSAQLGQLHDVAPAVARHRVDDGLKPECDRLPHLGGHPFDVAEREVRVHPDGRPTIDDQVLVGIGHPEIGWVDVAEHRPDGGHDPGPSMSRVGAHVAASSDRQRR